MTIEALDTSVAIPSLLRWDENHQRCLVASAGAVIPAHALLETYAVITRLPSPHRVAREDAHSVLADRYPPSTVLAAPVGLQRSLVDRLAEAGVAGGAVYDALVGLTATHHGAVLLTRDVRAMRTYDALGVDFAVV